MDERYYKGYTIRRVDGRDLVSGKTRWDVLDQAGEWVASYERLQDSKAHIDAITEGVCQ